MSDNSSPKPLDDDLKTSDEEKTNECVVEVRKEELDLTMTENVEELESEEEQKESIAEEECLSLQVRFCHISKSSHFVENILFHWYTPLPIIDIPKTFSGHKRLAPLQSYPKQGPIS